MFLCTIFAFKTRNFPRNFNEAKCIGISMYLTCSVWIIFLPSYLNTSDAFIRVYLSCATFIVLGTITLCGLLVPKVIILFFTNGQPPSVTENYTVPAPLGNTGNRMLSSAVAGSQLQWGHSLKRCARPLKEPPPTQSHTGSSIGTSTSNLHKVSTELAAA